MKVFTLLLAVFFTFLITVPCSDAGIHVSSKAEIEQQSHAPQTHSDLCSAFCTCTCCGVVMNIKDFHYPELHLSFPKISSKIVNKLSFVLCNFPSGIWQPPKIA
ncbi:DUF6660 family protein [Weeksellaceae bacterium A-14]